MYACVLIPRSLSLVLTLHPDPGNLLEMSATIWSNGHLTPGAILHPDEGELRLDKLEVYSVLGDNDLRRRFGCYDVIQDVDGQEIRHCNWVRFVKISSSEEEANVIGCKVKGNAFYQVIKCIKPNDEIVVLFQTNYITSTPEKLTISMTSSNSVTHTEKEITVPPNCLTFESQDDSAEKFDDDDKENHVHLVSRDQYTSEEDEKDAESVVDRVVSNEEKNSMQEDIAGDSEPEADGGFFSDSKGENSDQSDNSSALRDLAYCDMESDQSSPRESDQLLPREDKLTSKKILVPAPCPATSATPQDADPVCRLPQDGARKSRERTWWPCDVCPKKFDRPSLLKRHVRTHTGEKPHACDVCGKAFSTSSSLNTHRRIHSGEKPHQCPTCGKRFTASSNLYYHRMTHNKEKPHKCTLCSKSFPTPGDLRGHMYVHSGTWPYKCQVCGRGFSKHTNLKNHLQLHSGDKPHVCGQCGKRFALQCNLKTHLKTHEEENAESAYNQCDATVSSDNKGTDGTCVNCPKLCPSIPVVPITHRYDDTESCRTRTREFSSSTLTEQAVSYERNNSPGLLPGKRVSPPAVASPCRPFYGHRPWLTSATGSHVLPASSPSSLVPVQHSQYTSPPIMTCLLKDMTSLSPYTLFTGKTSTPASNFISPHVLARGSGFLSSAHAPSFYQLTSTAGWHQQLLVQGL